LKWWQLTILGIKMSMAFRELGYKNYPKYAWDNQMGEISHGADRGIL